MIPARKPLNETERLAKLLSYEILDTPPEIALDEIAKLASMICSVPIGLISLVDSERQWFKSTHGIAVTETPRDISFCAHAILSSELLWIPDASVDPRFSGNPLVTSGLNVRFYAGAPLLTADGHALGTLCIVDSTPREENALQKESLTILARHVMQLFEMRALAKRNAERSSELIKQAKLLAKQNEQLYHAEKMSAVGSLSAGLAHEINNPLSVVQARLELLAEAPGTSEEMRNHVEHASNACHRIGSIVDGLKAYSRDGRHDAVETFELSTVIDEVASMVSTRFLKSNVRIDFAGFDEAHVVSARQGPLIQILVNLLVNALDAVEETLTPWVRVEASADGSDVILAVIDSGLGIDPSIAAQIMEPFFTTKPVGRGTGLGLSISKGLAEAMGAKFEIVETAVNTTFSLKLPKANSVD